MEINEYRKILEDPAAEAEALRRRCYAYLEDSQYITNKPLFRFVYATISMLGDLREEWEYAKAQADDSDPDALVRYWIICMEAKRVVLAKALYHFREQLDILEGVTDGGEYGTEQRH